MAVDIVEGKSNYTDLKYISTSSFLYKRIERNNILRFTHSLTARIEILTYNVQCILHTNISLTLKHKVIASFERYH